MSLHLRPLSVGDILDGAFTLYRRNFATFLVTALVPQIPLLIMWVVLPLFIGNGSVDLVMGSLVVLSLPYTLLAASIVWAALAYAMMRAYEGESPSAGASIKVAIGRLISVLIAGVIVVIAMTIGLFLLIVPAFIFAAMFFAFLHAIVIEGRNPFDALSRSAALAKGAKLRILGVSFIAYCITALPSLAFGAVAGVAGGWGLLSGGADAIAAAGWVGGIMQACGIIVGAITTPFSVGVLTLLYVDRRARTEAPDLEAAAELLG